MKRFGHVVCNHIPSWSPDYGKFALCDAVGNKEIPYIYMLHALADKRFPIIFQNNRGLVVLVQTIVLGIVTLSFKEILCPADHWHEVFDSYYLSLRRASTVELLFGGTCNGKPTSHRQSSSRVSSNVRVDCKRCVHPKFEDSTSIFTEDQRQCPHAGGILHQPY